MKIALLGTRGVPARYGGFETAVEEIGRRLVERGHDVSVYCRKTTGTDHPTTYLGMRLIWLPAARRKSLETLSHTALSVLHAMGRRYDAAIVFNAANSIFLPLLRLRRIPVATHVDGLEWRRTKWKGVGRHYYRAAEVLAVRWSDALIADAQGIADYYTAEFGAATELIVYGAPIRKRGAGDRLVEVGAEPGSYHLLVARFEPENHVDVIVEGYRASAAAYPLLVVGSAPYADDYTAKVRGAADGRVRFLGGIWDQELLDQLYANCTTYLHGHSVGGTNPSLLRAVGASAPVIAYDVSFNREVLAAAGRYFVDAAEVGAAVEAAECDPVATKRRGDLGATIAARYDWDDVAGDYEKLAERLCSGGRLRWKQRRSGRRTGIDVDALLRRRQDELRATT